MTVDWRGLRAHLDGRLLRQRDRRTWLLGCTMAFLSILGSWTLPWHSTLRPGSAALSDYTASYVDHPNAVNAFHTLAWLLILPTVAALVAYAALTPWPDPPAWVRLVPVGGLGVLAGCAVLWGLSSMRAAAKLTEAYEYTETGFPGGVGFMALAIAVLLVGGRRLGRARAAEAAAGTSPGQPPAPPVAPPSVPPATPPV